MLERVQYLLDKRIIREITPIFDTRAFGYESMLVAAKVDPAFPHRAAQFINTHPGVTHNYLRDHDFNLWFTIAVEPDSQLGLDGTLEVIAAQDGRRVDPPAADAEALQDPHGPRDGGRDRRAEHGGRGGRADGARADRADRGGHRDGPGDAGPDAGRPRALRAGRRAARRAAGGRSSSGSSRSASAAGCGASRRSSTTAAPASPPTAWASGPCPTGRSSRPASGWPPSAASRTATSGRPTRTGPTPSSRWPTAAPRRSATPSSTRSPTTTGIEQRATLYSSTEFKKVRMLYFTDAFARWEQEHGS